MANPASVPLFPLPDHVLLPGMPMPYRLFEPRYRALAEHLDGLPEADRYLALPRLLDGADDPPPFAPVAALAAVRRLEQQDDGTWLLVVEGLDRVRLHEIPSAAPFRRAALLPTPDLAEDPADLAPLTARVRDLALRFRALLGERGALLDPVLEAQPLALVDQLGALLIGSPDERQRFLEERRRSARAQRVRRVLVTLTGSHGEPSLN